MPCRIRFFRDSTRLIFLLLPSRPRPPAVGTRIRQPRKLAPDCAGLLEALYLLEYCWAETCERRRLCLRGSVLLLPAPGAGPAAPPRARTQLCKHEGAVSTVSLVSPSPVQCPSSPESPVFPVMSRGFPSHLLSPACLARPPGGAGADPLPPSICCPSCRPCSTCIYHKIFFT